MPISYMASGAAFRLLGGQFPRLLNGDKKEDMAHLFLICLYKLGVCILKVLHKWQCLLWSSCL